jgi:hypothetical protein
MTASSSMLVGDRGVSIGIDDTVEMIFEGFGNEFFPAFVERQVIDKILDNINVLEDHARDIFFHECILRDT